MKDDVYLMFVDIKDGVQSNKFYNMKDKGDGTFNAHWGRVDSTEKITNYSIHKWDSTVKSKVRKGYKDISNLKNTSTAIAGDSGNSAFDEFYNIFRQYTGDMVRKTFLAEGCSPGQLEEAQAILNKLAKIKKVDKINENLLELYKVIPRRMGDVRNFLINDKKQVNNILTREQDALDSMDSSNIINVSNPYTELGVGFSKVDDITFMEDLLYPTMGGIRGNKAKIHKVYAIGDDDRTKLQDKWLKQQNDKSCELLIHGTRNANIFSILKSGLLIRPSNAHFSGAVYGDGVYHSAHSAKSLNYTGWDNDKIFLIQNVHMGNHYEYAGYYRDGKDISRSEMNYKALKKKGYDSLFVKAGDGLLDSEYIVYNKEQTNTKYLVWMK